MSIFKCKISKEEFIEVIVNNIDGKTNLELAEEMGISKGTFYKLQDEYAIRTKDEVKKLVQRFTSELVTQLRKNAKNGSDRAVQMLMELGEIYTPSNKLDVKGTVSVLYAVGVIRTPIDAGLSPGKKIKSSEVKQIE